MRSRRPLSALTIVLMAAGLIGFPAEGAAREDASDRVVSLSPRVTEILIGIGAEALIVAVDAESARLPGLNGVAVVSQDSVASIEADLVIVPATETGGKSASGLVEALRRRKVDVLEFGPHDYDDAVAFCETLGVRLGRGQEARAYARELTRPLALLSVESLGKRRPRIALLLGLDPLTLAGGHSFLTDLVEAAGAENVTHGLEEYEIEMTIEELALLAPEWLVFSSPHDVSAQERARIRARFRSIGVVEFLRFQPDRIWLHNGIDVARRLRALVVRDR